MKKIGRYELIRELGRGGMAVVHLARDPYMDREVAVKILPAHLTQDPQFRARFQREAQVIAALDHPAIVPVYDFGDQEGRLFIVMRYMAGASLSDQLKRRGPFSVLDTSKLLERIGSALDEAHLKGIVHRDLKPANILFDDRGQPFVGDFGIVKLSEATIAYTGQSIIGTPGYMSPEQARGDSEIDGRSDIYALGAIAYEMLTGKLPYRADTPVGLMMKHIIDPVPDVLKEKPDLPAQCGTTITKAMAKERQDRFATCAEIARSLAGPVAAPFEQTLLEPPAPNLPYGEATLLEPPPRVRSVLTPAAISPTIAEPVTKAGRKVPVWALAGGCLALLLCGGIGAVLAGVGFGGFGGNDTPTSEVATAIVVVDGLTPELPPTDTPEVVDNDQILDSDFAGLRFLYPAGWVSDEDLEVISVASNREALEDDLNSGAAVAIFTSDSDVYESNDPVEMLHYAIDNFGLAENLAFTQEPQQTSIKGQSAATADVTFSSDGGTPLTGIVAVIANGDRIALVFAATPIESGEEYLPTLEAILFSVEVRNPAQFATLDEVDISNTKGVLTYGVEVDGTIDPGEYAVWNLIGFETDNIEVLVGSTDGLDAIVDVLDENGASILAGGAVDDGGSIEFASDIFLPYSGDYYIVIRGYADSSGVYTLNVAPVEQLAELDMVGTALVIDDTLSDSEHIFPFTAEQSGGTLEVYVDGRAGMDIIISLYDDDIDTPLLQVDDAVDDEWLTFQIEKLGSYSVRVDTTNGVEGDYLISLLGPPEIIFELAPGDSVISRFDESSVIEYRFRGFTGDPFRLEVLPETGLDVVLELIDLEDAGNTLFEVDDGFEGELESLSLTPDHDAIYLIRVRGYNSAVGGYSMEIYSE